MIRETNDDSKDSLSYQPQSNELPELFQPAGRTGASKTDGGLDSSQLTKIPSIVDRLQLIESRLEHVESQMPIFAALLEAVVRIADHLAPPTAKIVGSRYIADRLGCTTTWVGRMAAKGMIPGKCIVRGTGNGHLWKFNRQQVDDWLSSRSPNAST